MTSQTIPAYPRPDFERTDLKWSCLNGAWDFVHDDLDLGRAEAWFRKGLPNEVQVVSLVAAGEQSEESHRITQQIAAQPEKLRKPSTSSGGTATRTVEKRKIEVPYVFQTEASGINNHDAHEVLWYERQISELRSPEEIRSGHRLLLRFGAVDYEATVWVGGQHVGSHGGGHVPFEIDISDAIGQDSARLTVRVRDSPYDCGQPRGKQYWGPKPESIFYTPSSGIWQSVWLEVIPATRIGDSSHGTVLQSNDIESGQLHVRIAVDGRRASQKLRVQIEASIAGAKVSTSEKDLSRETSHVSIDLDMRLPQSQLEQVTKSLPSADDKNCWRDGVALWSPDHPLLYDIVIRLFDIQDNLIDEVKTYTGMRSLDWTSGHRTFMLNGQPLFQTLVLDQGYWPSTGMTPSSSESLKADIELSKAMGFNGCRKHQKVEDPAFLYWADRIGYLVWGEAANGYWFNDDYIRRFDQEWMEAVRRDINHPCIITWTPVNESWGYTLLKDNIKQRDHIRSLYYMTKTLDPTRPINDNCGWEHVCNDLTTFHEYADAPDLAKVCSSMDGVLSQKAGRDMFVRPIEGDAGATERPGAPVLCTEFGGVNIAPAKDDATAREDDWGYTTASDAEDLLKRFEALVMAVVNGGHCCGFVYTQLTDIEQEVNGLYTFDRKPKLNADRVKAILDKAKSTYYSARLQKQLR